MVDRTTYLVESAPGKGLTYHEWHAFVSGVYGGFREASRPDKFAGSDSHYWSAGYVCGALLRYGLLLLALTYV